MFAASFRTLETVVFLVSFFVPYSLVSVKLSYGMNAISLRSVTLLGKKNAFQYQKA